MRRTFLPSLLLIGALLAPSVASAQDDPQPARDEGPSLFQYGFRGFWNGAFLGLAVGHLATGSEFESGEWKALVMGAGIGAVIGVGGGISLAFADRSSGAQTGRYVLRDMWYGTLLGGLTGAAIGALVMIDSEKPRDVLTGAAIGGLIGGAFGVAFGILEGASAPRRPQSRYGVTLAVLSSERGFAGLVPGLRGAF